MNRFVCFWCCFFFFFCRFFVCFFLFLLFFSFFFFFFFLAFFMLGSFHTGWDTWTFDWWVMAVNQRTVVCEIVFPGHMGRGKRVWGDDRFHFPQASYVFTQHPHLLCRVPLDFEIWKPNGLRWCNVKIVVRSTLPHSVASFCGIL